MRFKTILKLSLITGILGVLASVTKGGDMFLFNLLATLLFLVFLLMTILGVYLSLDGFNEGGV